jgi:hypothetical protein
MKKRDLNYTARFERANYTLEGSVAAGKSVYFNDSQLRKDNVVN